MARNNRSRRNAPEAVFGRDSELRRLSTSAVELTAEEKRFLKDPSQMDEDEADALLAQRRIKDEEAQAIPFEDILEKFGYEEKELDD